ncbi:MAG: hypothetical protein BEN18_08220 [Epulopiscium sp. Nuni2H_MBin001]|nr:MAG: hypothetical protein BEN18_08220 [Epulopiscium sp. Nuni2H_MBin001]
MKKTLLYSTFTMIVAACINPVVTYANPSTVFNQEVITNNQYSVTLKDINPNNMFGYSVNVLLENKSADTTYMYSVDSATINGIACDPLFASTVAPGKKSNAQIIFNTDDLEEMGLTDFTHIEITFRVYDANNWSIGELPMETIHIYPQGVEAVTKFVRTSLPTDKVLVDNEYVTITFTGQETDWLGYNANLFLENKTDTTIMFSTSQESVNGYMLSPLFAKTVKPGTSAIGALTWPSTSLEENDINVVEEIEVLFKAYDYENFMRDSFVEEVVIFQP